ncbi:hypothetical protein FHW69_003833 [Luteibacter sp. Sphag1AF]|nr:hypothetical protein [Luteibacter sp. Sphag1AF]
MYDNPECGGLFGAAQFTRGVTTLLPKADYVWFYSPESRETVSIPWQDAETVLPMLLTESSYYPELFLVSDFPNEDQLAALRQSAVTGRKVPCNEEAPASN